MHEIGWVEDSRLRDAAVLPAGPEQWAAVRALDPVTLSHDDRLAVIELTERCKAALDADQQPVYAALSHGNAERERDCVEWVCHELSQATKYSAGTCGSRMMVGQALYEQFPGTLGLMASGRVTYWYGRALVDETACLSDDMAARVEKRVLDRAPDWHLGEYRQAVRRALVAVDPEGAAERATAAQRDRNVWVFAATDATACLGASNLPVADAVAAYEHLDGLARAGTGDGRTPRPASRGPVPRTTARRAPGECTAGGEDGGWTWTTPSGRRYAKAHYDYRDLRWPSCLPRSCAVDDD